jgi:hypothetical protein
MRMQSRNLPAIEWIIAGDDGLVKDGRKGSVD